MAARPDIDERVSQLVSKGRWQVPGYKVRSALPSQTAHANTIYRNASATFLCYSWAASCLIDHQCIYWYRVELLKFPHFPFAPGCVALPCWTVLAALSVPHDEILDRYLFCLYD